MTCADQHDLIHRRLDGDLGIDDAVNLGRHLAGCAACSAFAAELDATVAALAARPAAEPLGLARLVLSSLPRPHRRARWALVGMAAAVAAGAVVAVRLPANAVPPAGPERAAVPPDGEAPYGMILARLAIVAATHPVPPPAAPLPDAELAALRDPATAGAAAERLAGAEHLDPATLGALRAAALDPATAAVVGSALAASPRLEFVPLYIAALPDPATRHLAREALVKLAGRDFGHDTRRWREWLAHRDRS
jgi:hypothetical protein